MVLAVLVLFVTLLQWKLANEKAETLKCFAAAASDEFTLRPPGAADIKPQQASSLVQKDSPEYFCVALFFFSAKLCCCLTVLAHYLPKCALMCFRWLSASIMTSD